MREFLAVVVLFGGLLVGGLARRRISRSVLALLILILAGWVVGIVIWQHTSGYLFLPPVLPILYAGMATDTQGHRLVGIVLLAAALLLFALGAELIAYV